MENSRPIDPREPLGQQQAQYPGSQDQGRDSTNIRDNPRHPGKDNRLNIQVRGSSTNIRDNLRHPGKDNHLNIQDR